MTPTLVIGVDPDKDTPAFASVLINEDLGILVGRVALGDSTPTLPLHVNADLSRGGMWRRAFIESPRAEYSRGKGARIQDIVELARRAGEMGSLLYSKSVQVDYITPAEWKGQVPKDISQARICSRLGWPYEQMAGYTRPTSGFENVIGAKELKKSDWKHVMDAIGIALWGADTIVGIERRRLAIERSDFNG